MVRGILTIGFRWAARGLAASSLLLFLLALLIQTPPAKRGLATLISRLASRDGQIMVRIEDLGGMLPLDPRIGKLSIGDAEGPWLVVHGLEVDAAPLSLVRGRIRFRSVLARGVDFSRLPSTGREQEDESEQNLPRALRAAVVDRLHVREVRLGHRLLAPIRDDQAPAKQVDAPSWSAPVAVEFSGSYLLHEEVISARGTLSSASVEGLLPPSIALATGEVGVHVALEGPIQRPEGSIAISVDKPRYGEYSATELGVELNGHRDPRDPEGPDAYALTVETSLRNPRISSLVDALLGPEVRLAVRVRMDPDAERIRVGDVELAAAAVSATTEGRVEGQQVVVPSLRVDLADLGRLGAPVDELVEGGRLDVSAAVEADTARGTASGTATVKAVGLDMADRDLQRFLGPQVMLSGKFEVERGVDVLRVSDLRIESAQAKARGDLLVHGKERAVEGVVAVEVANIEALSSTFNAAMAGALQLDATIGGTAGALEVEAVARSEELRIASGPPLSGTVTLKARDLTGTPRGNVRADLGSRYGRLAAAGDFAMVPGRSLELSALALESTGVIVRGGARVNLESKLVDATLEGDFASLEALSPFVGGHLDGRGGFDARLTGVGEQNAEFSLRMDGVSYSGLRSVDADSVRIEARLRNLYGKLDGIVGVTAADVSAADLSIHQLRTSATGKSGRWSVAGEAEGRYLESFRLETTGGVRVEGKSIDARVDRLEGVIGSRPLRLRQPLLVSSRPAGGISIDQLDVGIAEGRLHGQWRTGAEGTRGAIEIEALPVDLVQLYDPAIDLRGTLDGRVLADGAAGRPDIRFSLQADPIEIGKGSDIDLPSFVVRSEGRWTSEGLVADARLLGGEATHFDVHAELPSGQQAELSVGLDGSANLALVNGLGVLGEDRIGGVLEAELGLGGTPEAPRLSGHVSLRDGSYENAAIGATLRDMELRLAGRGRQMVLEQFQATDGNQGRIAAAGAIDFTRGLTNATYDLRVVLDSAHIARLDDLSAEASGDLSLAGRGAAIQFDGRIQTERANVRIPDRLPPGVVVLDVAEENVVAARSDRYTKPEPPATVPVALNLTVKLPGQVFVRGADVDTEWKGEVHIGGTSDAPVLDGKLSLVRGSFKLLNVRLKAVKGAIAFDGGPKIDPIIEIVGEAKKHDILARVTVSGRATKPSVSFSSEPSLPEDEILARLLFGKRPTELSAVESLQLAAAVARLSGGGSGADPLGFVRRAFNVDTLDVSGPQTEGGGSVLSVGKYVTEGVFVSINQGLTENTSTASVEVDVTDNVTLESKVGNDAGSLGVNWKWDY